MDYIILDLESGFDEKLVDLFNKGIKTRANLKDPEKIKLDIEAKKAGALGKMMVDPDFATILCIGIKINKEPAKIVTLKELAVILNGGIIEPDIDVHVRAGTTWHIITFNGLKFDIPLIIKQGIKQGINMPYRFLNKGLKKYGNPYHTDLMELICGGDYKSLDTLLQIYLGIEKTPIDFMSCTQEELEGHCLEDISNTNKLFKKFRPLL